MSQVRSFSINDDCSNGRVRKLTKQSRRGIEGFRPSLFSPFEIAFKYG